MRCDTLRSFSSCGMRDSSLHRSHSSAYCFRIARYRAMPVRLLFSSCSCTSCRCRIRSSFLFTSSCFLLLSAAGFAASASVAGVLASVCAEHACTSVKRSFSTGMSASSAFFASAGVENSTMAELDSGCSYASARRNIPTVTVLMLPKRLKWLHSAMICE